MSDAATHAPGPPHIAVRPEWLALEREAPLEPALPVVDAHHHLWEFPDKVYRTGDLLADMAGGPNIVSTVFVECKTHYLREGPEPTRCVGEMHFVNGEREEAVRRGAGGIAAAAVGHADLRLGDAVSTVLDALLAAAHGHLRSIRNIAVWHADPAVRVSAANPPRGLMADPAFREGFACLSRKGLVFDAWLIHTQLDELADLARTFASTQIVLNHVGGPLAVGPYAGQRASVFADWREGMAKLARLPNVAVKIGGFGMPLFGFGFHLRPVPPSSAEIAEAIGPYVEACIELFGSRRCMFESNFPVDKGSFNYNTLWNAFTRLARHRSAGDVEALFAGTARSLYRLP